MLRRLDLAVGKGRYGGLEVHEGCTVGQWKQLLGQGCCGTKILYPERLICRSDGAGDVLEDGALLPEPPARLHVGGPHIVLKMLELALKDKLEVPKPPKKPPAPPRPQQRRGAGAALGPRGLSALGGAGGAEAEALQVQCPEGAGPGSVLEWEDPRTGQAFRFEVPEGTAPGGHFEVRLAQDAERGLAGVMHAESAACLEAPLKGEPSAASVLAAPLEQAVIDDIRTKFPDVVGELPQEAAYWSEGDLSRYLASGGRHWPTELAQEHGGQTCALLRQLRLYLAERKVEEVTEEYKAVCKHFGNLNYRPRLSGRLPLGFTQLPAISASVEKVPQMRQAPEQLREPFVLEAGTFPMVGAWDLDFWRRHYGDWDGPCRARSPASAEDAAGGAGAVALRARVGDYVDYAQLLARLDPACSDGDAVAYFRVHMDGWPAFREAMFSTFSGIWKDLSLPGLEDKTVRWVQMFADKFRHSDWLETLAGYYTVTLAAPGCVTRLHRESHGAHLWLAQTEGRRLVFLFAPAESARLYARTSTVDTRRNTSAEEADGGIPAPRRIAAEGRTASVSPVDIFGNSSKRFPALRDAAAQAAVLEPGETLVVPSGWWWYSVALEPSATIQHRFYNSSNFRDMARDLEDSLEHFGDNTRATLAQLQEEILEDNEDWSLVVQDE